MKQKLSDPLTRCALFNNMEDEERTALLSCLKPKTREIGKGELLHAAGDPFEGIGVVLTGSAAVVKENAEGNRIILTLLKPGDLFGEMAAFSGMRKYPATVIAQEDCSVMYLPPEKILGQCERVCISHQSLIMNMMDILAKKALTLSRKLEYLSIRSMRGRIANFLLEQYKMAGQTTFMLPMNRNELADFLNVTRPSLSRELGRMKDEGLLDFYKSSVQLKDIKALMQAAE